MNRSKKIFVIVAVLFTLVVIAFALDMCSRTTPPWEKKTDSLKKYKVKQYQITKKKLPPTTLKP
ncbi:MAG: hypothetical protein JWM14_2375 [Chitinophagaceae bacterium]|nr:hypothetical protein [Chitinophagaceae bacterium]